MAIMTAIWLSLAVETCPGGHLPGGAHLSAQGWETLFSLVPGVEMGNTTFGVKGYEWSLRVDRIG